jgi:DNA-binding PadR family transcriptional regulator
MSSNWSPMRRTVANDFLPLTPIAFEILLSLANGESHGYRILLDIEERTDGRLRPHAGTLYRAMARLVEQGLLEELEERPDLELDDERRRYYGLTRLGRAVAAAEAARLQAQVEAARQRRLLKPGLP